MLGGYALSFACVKRSLEYGCYEPSHVLQATLRPEVSDSKETSMSLDEKIGIEGSHLQVGANRSSHRCCCWVDDGNLEC